MIHVSGWHTPRKNPKLLIWGISVDATRFFSSYNNTVVIDLTCTIVKETKKEMFFYNQKTDFNMDYASPQKKPKKPL